MTVVVFSRKPILWPAQSISEWSEETFTVLVLTKVGHFDTKCGHFVAWHPWGFAILAQKRCQSVKVYRTGYVNPLQGVSVSVLLLLKLLHDSSYIVFYGICDELWDMASSLATTCSLESLVRTMCRRRLVWNFVVVWKGLQMPSNALMWRSQWDSTDGWNW